MGLYDRIRKSGPTAPLFGAMRRIGGGVGVADIFGVEMNERSYRTPDSMSDAYISQLLSELAGSGRIGADDPQTAARARGIYERTINPADLFPELRSAAAVQTMYRLIRERGLRVEEWPRYKVEQLDPCKPVGYNTGDKVIVAKELPAGKKAAAAAHEFGHTLTKDELEANAIGEEMLRRYGFAAEAEEARMAGERLARMSRN